MEGRRLKRGDWDWGGGGGYAAAHCKINKNNKRDTRSLKRPWDPDC